MRKIFNASDNIEIRHTGKYGYSLFAKRNFKRDELVFIVSGKVISYHTDYTIPIDHELMIEPRQPWSFSAYLNHSCDPNLGIRGRTHLVALRKIKKGEEVRTNYAFLGYEYGQEKTIDGKKKKNIDLRCNCGSANCRGFLGSYKYLEPRLRQKYKKYISDYLLDNKRYPYKKGGDL